MHPEPSIVFVVDDDPSMREALVGLFRSVRQPVEWFESAEAFLSSTLPDLPACLVLDVRLPGRSGLELQKEMVRLGKGLPVVFITGHGDIRMSVTAMKTGAIEFLTKPFRDQELLDAVQRAIAVDRARRIAAAEAAHLRRRYETLSAREREVMALVASGLLNKEVAARLGISEITTKVHRGQVMRKMQAGSLAELVRFADKLATGNTKQ